MNKSYIVVINSKGDLEIQKVNKVKAVAMAATGKAHLVDKCFVHKK